MIEVGKTYVTKEGNWRCIAIEGDSAYMVRSFGGTAYVWDINTGKSVSLNENYDLISKGFREASDDRIAQMDYRLEHDEDAELIAAAPDLAQSVITQSARIADLERQLAEAREVKPLEWFEVEKSRNGGKYTADGYTIRYIEGLWLLDFAGQSRSVWRFLTLEATKAAAQADYAARILSALKEPKP